MIQIRLENGAFVIVKDRKVSSDNELLQEICRDIAEHLPFEPYIPDLDCYIANAIVERLGGIFCFPAQKPVKLDPRVIC